MRGRYFEQLTVGDTVRTAGRTVTETDLMTFLGLAGIYEEFYTNVEYARNKTIFGERFVPGLLTLSLSEGLALQTGWFDGTGMALLEVNTRLVKPVFLGDTIFVDITVTDKRETSKPDRGIVFVQHTVWKRDGQGQQVTVLEVEKRRMVRRLQEQRETVQSSAQSQPA